MLCGSEVVCGRDEGVISTSGEGGEKGRGGERSKPSSLVLGESPG